jgi:hypothetical protein
MVRAMPAKRGLWKIFLRRMQTTSGLALGVMRAVDGASFFPRGKCRPVFSVCTKRPFHMGFRDIGGFH